MKMVHRQNRNDKIALGIVVCASLVRKQQHRRVIATPDHAFLSSPRADCGEIQIRLDAARQTPTISQASVEGGNTVAFTITLVVNPRGVGCLPIWHNYLSCHFAGDSRPVARKVRRLASVCSTWCFGKYGQ